MNLKHLPGKRLQQITVIGDGNAGTEEIKLAERLGKSLAELGYIVVTGGKGGIMEAVSKGVSEAGGIAVGILPDSSINDANIYCTISIATGLGHARNVITALSCDAIVAIGGGAGTLSEICFGWIHQKPLFVFDQFGGWSEKLANQVLDNKYPVKIDRCITIKELVEKLNKIKHTT